MRIAILICGYNHKRYCDTEFNSLFLLIQTFWKIFYLTKSINAKILSSSCFVYRELDIKRAKEIQVKKRENMSG